MKYIKLFNENVVFNHTIYDVPNKEDLYKFNDTNLTAKEIFDEICYTIIGRGVLSEKNKEQIVQSAKILVDKFNNSKYKEVLKMASELKPRFK